MYTRSLWRLFTPLAVLWLLSSAGFSPHDPPSRAPFRCKPSIVYKIQGSDERLEMIVHTSRILTMEQKIVPDARSTIPTSST